MDQHDSLYFEISKFNFSTLLAHKIAINVAISRPSLDVILRIGFPQLLLEVVKNTITHMCIIMNKISEIYFKRANRPANWYKSALIIM